MKKLLFTLCVLSSVCFFSCSSDDEVAKEKETIEGVTGNEEESKSDSDSTTVPVKVIDDQGDIDLPEKYDAMNAINNAFSWKAFAYKVNKKAEIGNVLVSPFSLAVYLSMMDNGVEGTSRDELTRLLGFDGYSMEDMNMYYNILTRGVVEVDPSVKFTSCNAMWYESELAPKADFLSTLQSWYGTETKETVLHTQETLDEINSWVNDKTEGMIDKFYDSVDNIPYMFALLNAIYLKAPWTEAFDESLTNESEFYTIYEDDVTTEFMWKDDVKLLYYKGDDYAVSFMPLGNNSKMDAFFVLPDEDVSVMEIADKMVADWTVVTQQADSADMSFSMPKFDITYSDLWTDYLENVGCSDIFDPTKADFSPMSDLSGIALSDIQQVVRFIANETGVEAAAVTGGSWTWVGGENLSMVLDHPFIFGVREKSTGVILFMGCVVDPTE